MHELSIAINIVEIATEEAKKANVSSVLEIELEVGTLSGIVIDALEFAMDEAIKNSVLQNAKIKIYPHPAFCSNQVPQGPTFPVLRRQTRPNPLSPPASHKMSSRQKQIGQIGVTS